MPRHPFTVVFAGGGSGGHVYPTLAVIDALQKQLQELGHPLRLIRMGPDDGYNELFRARGVEISPVSGGKIRRYASLQNFIDVPKFFIGLCQALFKLFLIMPEVVFSKGGTGALPVVLAAWFYRIPVAVHESDAKPGLTNLFSARFARKVFVTFNVAAKYFNPQKVEATGAPIRNELLKNRVERNAAKESLGFEVSRPLTLVLGGSQGAQRINEFVLTNLGAIMAETQLLHQTGMANLGTVQKLSRVVLQGTPFKNRYEPVGYFGDELGVAFSAADLVVTRPGSGIMELAAFGLPSILIPITESANAPQQANAFEFAQAGAAVVIEESNLLPGIFMNQLKTILGNAELRAKMGAAAAKFFVPDAASKIAEGIIVLGTS